MKTMRFGDRLKQDQGICRVAVTVQLTEKYRENEIKVLIAFRKERNVSFG